MTPLFLYLLKASAIHALLLAFYYFVIRPGRRFHLMRAVLVLAMLLPLLFPLLPQPAVKQGEEVIPLYVIALPEVTPEITVNVEKSSWSASDWLSLGYFLTASLLSAGLLLSVASVVRRLRKADFSITPYGKVYIDNKAISPFSFFKWVFFPKNTLRRDDADLLLRHEFSHVAHKHSIDRLLSAGFRAFFWFSPFAHLNYKWLSEVHEYQADADAINASSDRISYTRLMAEWSGIYTENQIAHPFSAHLKKRFIMLNHFKPGKLNFAAIVAGLMLVTSAVVLTSMIQPENHLKGNLLDNSLTVSADSEVTANASSANTEGETILLADETSFPADLNSFSNGDTNLIPAEYPGGEEARIRFFTSTIRYPAEARTRNIQGTVYFSFTIDAEGKVGSLKIVRGIGGGCDEEVLRVAALMPDWKPATRNGKAVASSMVLPVKFTLSSGNEDEKTVFTVVEEMPEFPGGDEAKTAYMKSKLSYPESALKSKTEGTVYITFVVEKDGSVNDVKILRGVHPDLDAAAMKAVIEMPAWKPGKQRGEPVRVQFNLPVRFKLPAESQKPVKEVKNSSMVDGREVFNVVEVQPEFPGGIDALVKYLKEKNVYPEKARQEKVEGTVYINFIIEADGSVSNAKLLRGIGSGCDEVALESVKNMPAWKPGKNRGVAVPVSFNIPIKFTLDPSKPAKEPEMPEKSMYGGREVYNKVDEAPVFPGGNDALLAYFRSFVPGISFTGPEVSDDIYYVSLIIEADGKVTPGGISGSESKQVKEQLMSAVKDMPDWKPGKKAGKAVPVREILFLKK